MFTELMRWTPFDELLSVGAQLDRQVTRQARQLQMPAGMAAVDIQTRTDARTVRADDHGARNSGRGENCRELPPRPARRPPAAEGSGQASPHRGGDRGPEAAVVVIMDARPR